jgi:hypothetical protein
MFALDFLLVSSYNYTLSTFWMGEPRGEPEGATLVASSRRGNSLVALFISTALVSTDPHPARSGW